MESAEPLPGGAVKAPDLADLLDRAGSFVSVYLHTDPDVENARQLAEKRWKALRGELREMEAPDAALERIHEETGDAHTRGRVLGVVTDGGGAFHVEHGDPFQPQDFGRVGAVTYVLPMIRWRQASPPVIVVLIDRTGANLYSIARGAEEAREVSGVDWPVHKASAGGWSMRRYQERVENTWERKAENVAETLQAMARRFDPRTVVAAGDVRAVALLRESMPADLQSLVVEIAGDRPRGEKGDPIPEEVNDVVADVVRVETEALLERFRQEIGQGDLAAQGISDVVGALARAQVETLLIDDDLEDESMLWVGEKAPQIGRSAEELGALGIDDPKKVRSRDAVVHAALTTDAGIRVLENGSQIDGGVGALLRWRNGEASAP